MTNLSACYFDIGNTDTRDILTDMNVMSNPCSKKCESVNISSALMLPILR